jgi:hypothetical protein
VIFSEGGGSPVNGPFVIDRSYVNGLSVDLASARVTVKSSRIKLVEGQTIRVGTFNIACSTISGNNTKVGVQITGKNGYYPSREQQQVTQSTLSNFETALSVAGEETTLNIESTNFVGNTQYSIYSTSPNDIVATNNY